MPSPTVSEGAEKVAAREKKEKEKTPKVIVYFRPHSNYDGEFGFDWLRTGIPDDTLEYKAYKEIIEDGYGGTAGDLGKAEAYRAFTREYKKTSELITGFAPYHIPYLNLFSKTYSDTVTIIPAPPYEAKLQLYVEIKDANVDEIVLESNNDNLVINGAKKFTLSNKTKGTSLQTSDEITITCLKDLMTDEKITAYAYFKNDRGEQRKELAGELLVCKNDATVRKEEKFVFVSVITNIGGAKAGEFSEKEQAQLRNTLYQALVRPIIWVRRKNSAGVYENISLDMRSDARFQTRGMYVNSNGYIQKGVDVNSMVKYLKSEFMKDANNSRYFDCIPVFVVGVPGGGSGGLLGYCDTDRDSSGKIIKWIKNSVSFTPYGTRPVETMPHEALHGYGLRHTHREENPISDKNQKYIFPHGQTGPNHLTDATDNVMSYRLGHMKTTWHWQWKIINSKIK
jgi:hypothetical protein